MMNNLTLAASLTCIALLRAGPDDARAAPLRALKITTDPDLQRVLRRLTILASVTAIIASNRALNYLSRNNWTLARTTKWDWPNEVAVVTGGSGGIGAEIVQRLVRQGIKVAIVDIVEPNTALLKDGKVKYFHCDITSKENVDATAAEIKLSLGPPSILCNNAGVAHAHTILESSPSYLSKLYGVNVLAHYYTIQAFLPDMIAAKKGHVITICSLSSFIAPAGLVDYAGTKAAVMSLHEGLQQELKYRYNAPEIRTTIVHPTYVQTPLCDSFSKALAKSGAYRLTPDYVAGEIVNAILAGSSRQIILPKFFAFASSLRAWPWWLQNVARSITKEDMQRI